jgi:hypothetical protein
MRKAAATILAVLFVLSGWMSAMAVHAQVGSSTRDRTVRPMGPQGYSSRGVQEQPQQQEDRSVQRSAWLRGDDRQQEQLSGCFGLSSALAQHSRDIRKMVTAGSVKWKEVAGQVEDLQRGITLLSERHEQFAQGLNNGQRSWWEKPLQDIMLIQLALSDRIGEIDRNLKGEKPEAVPLTKALSDLEGQFRKWHDMYGQIAADMGLEAVEPRSSSGAIRGLPGAQGPGR